MKHVVRFEGVIVVDPKIADDILGELEKIALAHGGELNELNVIEDFEVEEEEEEEEEKSRRSRRK